LLAFYIASLDTEAERMKLADIYNEHKHVMLRYAISVTKSKEIAEDAIHNVFLIIIKHKVKYLSLDSSDLRSRLIVMTKHRCIDILRQGKDFADEPIEEMGDALMSPEIPIEEQTIRSGEYEAIRKCVASLDEASRIVLEMKYLLGMTYKEIGDELGITPKHVDTRIMRAKEKVRKLIVEGGELSER
jgi:RNA polymerase sigma-70 factor (ECF subfamily)